MPKRTVLLVSMLLATTGLSYGQDMEAGGSLFLYRCERCHDIGENAKPKMGPQLNNLEGQHSGTSDNYAFTDAIKTADIVWSEESFRSFIKDPSAKIPGTRMVVGGVKNDREISDLWAYLKQFGPEGRKK